MLIKATSGWETPKIRPEIYATGYGSLTDYLADIFAELRRRNFQKRVEGARQTAHFPILLGDFPARQHPHLCC